MKLGETSDLISKSKARRVHPEKNSGSMPFQREFQYLKSDDYVMHVMEQTQINLSIGHSLDIGKGQYIDFSLDGRYLAIGSGEELIIVFDLLEKKNKFILKNLPDGCSGSVNSIAFSPNGKVVAGGFEDGNIVIWSFTENKPTIILNGHLGSVNTVVFWQDGKYLASGSEDKSIKVWNLQDKREEFNLDGHSGVVYSVAFSLDGRFIASGSQDKCIKL